MFFKTKLNVPSCTQCELVIKPLAKTMVKKGVWNNKKTYKACENNNSLGDNGSVFNAICTQQ